MNAGGFLHWLIIMFGVSLPPSLREGDREAVEGVFKNSLSLATLDSSLREGAERLASFY